MEQLRKNSHFNIQLYRNKIKASVLYLPTKKSSVLNVEALVGPLVVTTTNAFLVQMSAWAHAARSKTHAQQARVASAQ